MHGGSRPPDPPLARGKRGSPREPPSSRWACSAVPVVGDARVIDGSGARTIVRSRTLRRPHVGRRVGKCPPMLPLLHSVAELEHDRARAALDPLLRPDAARRDRRGRRDHRDSLDAARRRLGSHLPRRGLGRRLRDRRRAALPRHHELERAARRVVGTVRDLEGRARRLGRNRARRHRGRDRREALGRDPSRSSPTASRRRSSSRRESAASATGGTRSSSASRPTCPGASRSIPRTGRSTTSTSATFHPTFLYEALWCFAAAGVLLLVERRFNASGRAASSRSTCSSTASAASGSRRSASTRRTRSRGVRLNVYVAGLAIVALGRVLRLVAARLEARADRPPPKVETMAIPEAAP